MQKLFFLDCETFSPVPISRGSHRYSEEAEVIVLSWGEGLEGEVRAHDLTADPRVPHEVTDAINDPNALIVGQNFGMFDRAQFRNALGLDIRPERVHDTMVQALAHGLPGGLDKLGAIFGISEEDAKMKEGKALIQLFCKPRPKSHKIGRATRHTHPAEWAMFLEYAKSDISAMRYIFQHMPTWNYPGVSNGNEPGVERRVWELDQRMNDRGFEVDVELAEAALAAVADENKILNERVRDMTADEVDKATRRDRLLRHIAAEYNVFLPDMSRDTLERQIANEDTPDLLKELLAIRLSVATTSNTKYRSLLNSVSYDNRLRGTLQYCGAARTGRWAGRIFQPQNLKRPSMKAKQVELGIAALKAGIAPQCYDDINGLASDALRGCIVAASGKKLLAADLSNIEGRTLAWLAGEQWKLDAFRAFDAGTGPDLYKLAYSRSFDVKVADIEDWMRQIGKVQELALGYQGAAGAFGSMAALYGIDLPEEKVWQVVRNWRAANSNIAQFWADCESAAWNAVTAGGVHQAGKIAFEKWRNWLIIHLPGGRRTLNYADPSPMRDPKKPGRTVLSYMGLDSYTRRWRRLTTYGGKIVENVTQAVARDVIADAALALDEEGFPLVLSVHDELIAEVKDDGRLTLDQMIRTMTRTPWWADANLPLAATGFSAYRYRK